MRRRHDCTLRGNAPDSRGRGITDGGAALQLKHKKMSTPVRGVEEESVLELVAPELVGMSPTRLKRIGDWMQRYVDERRLPGVSVLVNRRGSNAYFDMVGLRDIESAKPLEEDTIFRIYSMTKPITSVAVMMLYEQGCFQLDDPLEKFLPEFSDMQVLIGGDAEAPELEPARSPITIRHLLTHTSGLTYDFMQATPVDALYRKHKITFDNRRSTLAELTARAARMPLLFHPGSAWSYGISTDVLGRLVEVLSGQPLDQFFEEHILQPLGMVDTAFSVSEDKVERLAVMYGPPGGRGLGDVNAAGQRPEPGLDVLDRAAGGRFARPPGVLSGGGGLTSTVADYLRFCQMLVNKGKLDGVRLLGRKTVEYMTCNHLPGDMADMGQAVFSEASMAGVGFGLGFSVVLDPAKSQTIGSVGEYAWGGAASTGFWIDPQEELIVILMTQLMPSSTYPLRRELHSLVYQALVD